MSFSNYASSRPSTKDVYKRQELTNLKRKLTTARRGHKLLKDKQDELMRRFLYLVRENKELRRKVEEGIEESNRHMALARSVMSLSLIHI